MSPFWVNFSSEKKWTARIQAAHKIFKLWAVQGPEFFSFALETSAPKSQTGPEFFTCLLLQAARSPRFLLAPGLRPHFPCSLWLSFYFYLMAL
jgi:hypothetical protein